MICMLMMPGKNIAVSEISLVSSGYFWILIYAADSRKRCLLELCSLQQVETKTPSNNGNCPLIIAQHFT